MIIAGSEYKTDFEVAPLIKSRRTPYSLSKLHNSTLIIEFCVSGPLNLTLWRALKAPPGWHKSPRQEWKNLACIPVRFRCRDLTIPMPTPEQLETLRLQILLMVRA